MALLERSRMAFISRHDGSSAPETEPAEPMADGSSPKAAQTSESHAVRTYEELEGAEGRAVFFRPHRYTAADLAPLRAIVTVNVAGVDRECALRDVSQNGVAFVWPPGVAVELRQRVALVLRFGDHEASRGDAVVGSVREQDGCTVVGVSFINFLLKIEEILQLRTVRQWSSDVGGIRVAEKPWCVTSCDQFKAGVAELRLYLEDAHREFGAIEARLPWEVLHGPDNAARAELVSTVLTEFAPDVVRLSEGIDAALRTLPEAHRCVAAKEWSLRHVHGFLMQVPVLHRARQKPLGYPGDYGVLDFMYEHQFEGATLFARAVSLAFNQTRAARAVRCRKDVVKRQIEALLSRRAGSGQPVRVLSVASGAAQELVELFNEMNDLPAPLEIVLFEQDEDALAHAWRRLKPHFSRFPGAVRPVFLQNSIKRLLVDDTLFLPFDRFDIVYCCGLLDYLQPSSAVALMRQLAVATAPGGQLLVANMVDHPTRWLMEHHLDWVLNYRTRAELTEIGSRAVPKARYRILEEASGVNPILELVRE